MCHSYSDTNIVKTLEQIKIPFIAIVNHESVSVIGPFIVVVNHESVSVIGPFIVVVNHESVSVIGPFIVVVNLESVSVIGPFIALGTLKELNDKQLSFVVTESSICASGMQKPA